MSVDDAPAPDWARYGTPIDLDDTVNSRVVLLDHVGHDAQRILELGPSAGLMTAVLRDRGHRVTAIEIDPEAAELARAHADEVVVGDLDVVDDDGTHVLDRFVGAEFDSLIAADVLEHVKRPDDTLRRALDCVKHDGVVHLSIPNVAHGDIRLALLGARFDYVEHGLMDRTHIQMFTLGRLVDMIREAGLAPTSFHRARRAVGDTEVPVDENLVEFGRRIFADDPEADTYQWVVSCQRADVVGDAAEWPEMHASERSVVTGVLDLMNAPVARPVPTPADEPVAEAESLTAFVRRGLGAVRRRLSDSLRR